MLDTKTSTHLMFAMTQSALAIGSEQTAPLTAYWLLKDVNLVSDGPAQYGDTMNPDDLFYLNAIARDYLIYKDTHWSLRRDRSLKIKFSDWSNDYWIYEDNRDKYWIKRDSPLAVWCILNELELK
jgi:hypothetical protein